MVCVFIIGVLAGILLTVIGLVLAVTGDDNEE